MANIDSKYNIETNRGDMLPLKIKNKMDGVLQTFKVGDVIRFKIMEKNNCENVLVQKDVKVETESEIVQIVIPAEEMKFGEVISKPFDYWYEVELNPDTSNTITILGYTRKSKGPKILTLLPEGGDKK